jgi:EAL domain-containing protein (putative c-di-GMP-specific phosphodiesterase class I)
VEALLRWHHPDLGNVPPSRFVPVLEENGLILPVGEWVVEEACRQLKAWIEQGLGGLTASINISARQLQDKGIERKIADIVSSCSLDPSRIELELTESVLMNKPDEVAVLLTRIKQCGMRISVDDFGTGYSSLSYLKRFPLDVLKIDRSFVKDMLDNPEDVMIIRAIVALARSLKLRTVAEGVETEEQFSLLARLGCDEYQGYLVSPPLPGNQLAAMLVQ